MNFLRNVFKSVTGSGRNGEQNDEKAEKESDIETMEVESETETADDGASSPNVSGTTDKFCVTSSESETEFSDVKEDVITEHKPARTAVLKEAKGQNSSQTKEGQVKEVKDMRERNAEKAHAAEKEKSAERKCGPGKEGSRHEEKGRRGCWQRSEETTTPKEHASGGRNHLQR